MEKEFNEESKPLEQTPAREQPVYTPRPKWQVIAAWIGLVLFLLVIAGFYIHVARGGL